MEQRSSEWAAIAVCSVVIGGLVTVHAVQHTKDLKAAQAELANQERLARSEGIPLTFAELGPNSRILDNENAWTYYHRANQMLNEVEKHTNFWQAHNPEKLDDPATLKATREYLAQAKPALELAASGAKLERCNLNVRATDIGFRIVSEFKSIARVVEVEAGLEVHDGHSAQALYAVSTFGPMCGQLSQTHTLMAALVEEGLEHIFERTIRTILRQHGADPGVGAAAMLAISSFGPIPDLVLMAEGENILSLHRLDESVFESKMNPANAPGSETGEFKDVARVSRLETHPGMVDRWKALQIQATRDYVSLFKGVGDGYADLAAKNDQLDVKLDNPKDDLHAWRSLGSPHWSDVIVILAYQISNRRILLQAAKILADSVDHISTASSAKLVFPDKLPLTGQAARDPFGKAEYQYTHTATGFTISGLTFQRRAAPSNPGEGNKEISGARISFTYPALAK